MLPYFVLILIPILFSLFPGSREVKTKRISYSFFVCLVFMLALRAITVGNDTAGYAALFDSVKRSSWGALKYFDYEYGFILLTKLISLITGEGQVYLAVMALLTVLPFALFYGKESKNALLTVALFLVMPVFQMMFSGIRQALAVSVGIMAFYFAKNKRPLYFVLCVLLAFTVHKSAAVLLLLYPVYHLKLSKRSVPFVLAAFTAVFLMRGRILALFSPVLSSLGYEAMIGETSAYTMLILFFILAAWAFIIIDDKTADKDVLGLRSILVLCVFIQIFIPVNALAMRVNYYFLALLPVAVSRINSAARVKWSQMAKLADAVMTAFFGAYFAYTVLADKISLDIVPYKFFWS